MIVAAASPQLQAQHVREQLQPADLQPLYIKPGLLSNCISLMLTTNGLHN